MINPDFTRILLLLPGALLGLTVHEAAHAFVAWRLGDPTAKQLGRLTLNPMKHLDLFGTLMIFVVQFGWAKPVPVNLANFHRPKFDHLLVALAGPAANLVLAALAGFALRLLPVDPDMTIVHRMLISCLVINVILAVFNLLPVPPLDGSRLIHAFTPARYEKQYRLFERAAGLMLLGAILFGMVTGFPVLSTVINPPVQFFLRLFTGT